MSGRSRWRLVKSLTIYQVALLVEGFNPSEFEQISSHMWSSKTVAATAAILTALRTSCEDGTLKIAKEVYYGEHNECIDFERSLIRADDVVTWLSDLGFRDGFFVPVALDDNVNDWTSLYYAPKLEAANDAWKAVTADKSRLRGRSPKKAIELWLRENAAKYGLVNKDGSPNATGIEEIAKIANWKPTGGAPTTPKDAREPTGGFGKIPLPASGSPPLGSIGSDLEDDIPF